ncbi:MAG TPA: hypothetical protein VGO64_07065, partial [Candidatus Limnocylindrales bacterium]|nr:hypothetical protein [Candidatus Limnocylindrales bacterium]
MLDALVAEARLRWGLDLGAGLQVLAAETLVATPLEPAIPALIVPASVLRVERAAGWQGARPDATGSAQADVLPGRHGHGTDPLALLRR